MPFAVVRVPCADKVVLDVARAAFRVGGDGLDRPLAFELAQDVLVRHPDRVREHVQPAAVSHAHHDLVRSRLRRELDRVVEHRDHHVEPLERELLLPEEPLAQEPLHALDLAEPPEESLLLIGAERRAVATRLDRLAQPDALLMVGQVLELVRDRPAVGLGEPGQHVGERAAGDGDAQDGGGDTRLELGRQLRLEAQRLERGIADRLGAERVEPRCEVAVGAVRLDERHRGRDAAEQLRIRRRRLRGCGSGLGGRCRRAAVAAAACVAVAAVRLGGRSFSSRRAMPGWDATSCESPLSKSARHSEGTASGFSRYSSSRARA